MENIQQPHLMMCDKLPLPGSGEKNVKNVPTALETNVSEEKAAEVWSVFMGEARSDLHLSVIYLGLFFPLQKQK